MLRERETGGEGGRGGDWRGGWVGTRRRQEDGVRGIRGGEGREGESVGERIRKREEK